MNKQYDVAVIGGGPAGATFARVLASAAAGLSILLIDGQKGQGGKVCGGLLAPDAQKVLASFGLTMPNKVLADPQIFSVETIDLAAGLVRHYQRHYLNMDRAAFDRWLLSLVPESVNVVRGRCTAIEERGGSYKVNVRCDGETAEYTAAAVVGADGGGSVVRRSLFDRPLKQYVAIQQWFDQNRAGMPPYSCIFDPATSDSCSWTIVKDGRAVFGGAFDKQGCRKAFEQQKTRLEAHLGRSLGRPVRTEACLLSSPRKWRDFTAGTKGAFLVGEAAGFISASSFEGISSAMLSGRLLAECFMRCEDNGRRLALYKRKTFKLRFKLWLKTVKRWVLCSPRLRFLIMKSGTQSIKKY